MARDLDKELVRLVPGKIEVKMDRDMNLFTLINWTLDYSSADENCVEMNVKLKRKAKGEILITYFPTILLTAIAFATSFFKPFFFEAALSVNLTTMLVLTTIFISKMEGLPPTSDIKMIDIWLIICQLVPFSEVVLLTAIEYVREGDGNDTSNKVTFSVPGTSRKTFFHFQVVPLDSAKQAETEKGKLFKSTLEAIGRFYTTPFIYLKQI